MAAEMAIGQTKRQAQAAKVLPAELWKEYNNVASDAQGLLQLGFHATCAAIPMYGIHYARQHGMISQLVLCELALGLVSSFYFAGFHEIIHMTAFKSKWINTALSYPVGFGIFRGPNWFWCFHWMHHRYTQDPDMDPEISGDSADLMDPSRSVFMYARFLSGYPFGFERVMKMARGKMPHDKWVVDSGMQKTVRIESIVFTMLYAACALGFIFNESAREVILFYWLLPHMLGAGHLRYYQFAEHRGCESGNHRELDAWGSVRTTSTYFLYRRLAWNMPFHIEHHSWPSVPFYLLPEVHEKIKDNQPEQRCLFPGTDGYLAVHKEFVSRVMNGLPTSLTIEHVADENGAEQAVESRRAEISNMASERGSFAMSDVAKHNTKDDNWLVIDGVVIDVTTFMPEHPGGDMVLAGKAGQEVSKMFKMIHPEGTLERHLPERCIVGALKVGPGGLEEPLLSGANNGDAAAAAPARSCFSMSGETAWVLFVVFVFPILAVGGIVSNRS